MNGEQNFDVPEMYGSVPYAHPTEYLAHIDPADFLEDLEHYLKGERIDTNGEWKQQDGMAEMNDIGVARVMHRIRVAVNKVVFLSNLTEKQVGRICANLHIAIAEDFLYNHDDYQLPLGKANSMIDMIMVPIYTGLMRAESEGDRSLFRDTTEIRAATNVGSNQGQSSWLPSVGKQQR